MQYAQLEVDEEDHRRMERAQVEPRRERQDERHGRRKDGAEALHDHAQDEQEDVHRDEELGRGVDAALSMKFRTGVGDLLLDDVVDDAFASTESG